MIDIRAALGTLKRSFRYDRTIGICMLLSAGLASLYAFLAPPVYKATFQLSVEEGNISSGLMRDMDSMRLYMDSQAGAIKDTALIEEVVEKLHLRLSRKFANTDAVSAVKKAVRVDLLKGTNLINISAYMDNPDL